VTSSWSRVIQLSVQAIPTGVTVKSLRFLKFVRNFKNFEIYYEVFKFLSFFKFFPNIDLGGRAVEPRCASTCIQDTTPPQPNHNITPTHVQPGQCNPWNN